MRFAQILVALSSITCLVESAPFVPRDGKLQRNRRRAVDYPLLPYGAPSVPEPQAHQSLRKRNINYSVVPVDGGSAAGSQAAATTVISTVESAPTTVISTVESAPTTVIVTQSVPAVDAATKTIVRTKVMTRTHRTPGKTVHEKVFITTTELETSAMPLATQTVTETVAPVMETVQTIMTTPAPSSTQYYDNGQWHPPYPIKTLASAAYSNSSVPVIANRNAAATGGAAVAYPTGSYDYGAGYGYAYGYGSPGKRAIGTVGSDPPAPTGATYDYEHEPIKHRRSPGDSSEKVAGSELTQRELKHLRDTGAGYDFGPGGGYSYESIKAKRSEDAKRNAKTISGSRISRKELRKQLRDKKKSSTSHDFGPGGGYDYESV